eukprot:914774-Pelagomonas_calceolata.AAC.6
MAVSQGQDQLHAGGMHKASCLKSIQGKVKLHAGGVHKSSCLKSIRGKVKLHAGGVHNASCAASIYGQDKLHAGGVHKDSCSASIHGQGKLHAGGVHRGSCSTSVQGQSVLATCKGKHCACQHDGRISGLDEPVARREQNCSKICCWVRDAVQLCAALAVLRKRGTLQGERDKLQKQCLRTSLMPTMEADPLVLAFQHVRCVPGSTLTSPHHQLSFNHLPQAHTCHTSIENWALVCHSLWTNSTSLAILKNKIPKSTWPAAAAAAAPFLIDLLDNTATLIFGPARGAHLLEEPARLGLL